MESMSLDQRILWNLTLNIKYENIVNSCVQKFQSNKNIDSVNKKEYFNKCLESKVHIYNLMSKFPEYQQ